MVINCPVCAHTQVRTGRIDLFERVVLRLMFLHPVRCPNCRKLRYVSAWGGKVYHPVKLRQTLNNALLYLALAVVVGLSVAFLSYLSMPTKGR